MLGMEQVYVRYGFRWLAAILVGFLLAVFVGHGTSYAQGVTIEVNSYGDAKSNDGSCTLREAVISANNDNSFNKPGECAPGNGDDTILLPPGTYTLTRSDNGSEDASTTGDLDVTSNVTITAAGPGLVVIDASGINDRAFHIVSQATTLRNVTILGGTANGDGGGILVESGATLTMVNATLTDNEASNGNGGGLFVHGTAALTNTTISQNIAANGSGVAADGNITLRNAIVTSDSCYGSVSSAGANLFHNAGGCPAGPLTLSGDPLLDSSVLPGFFTLQAGSPAIGAGLDDCPLTDQLGQARNSPAGCDLGADEYPRDLPVATADEYSTNEDQTLSVGAPGVLENDDPSVGLSAVLVANPSHGSLTLNPDGSFAYTPNADFNGVDSFTYRANDGELDSNEATVTITVDAVNDAPAATDDTYSTDEDTVLTVPAPGVLGNDSDIDSEALSAVLLANPSNGSLTLNPDGSFAYTPNANFNGVDSFTYKANDGALDSNIVTVSITVHATNDAPQAVSDGYATDEDVMLNVSAPGILGNDTDPENDALSAVVVSGPNFGVLTLNADGSFSYRPFDNFFGEDSFTYTANDASGASAPTAVTISVASDGIIEVNTADDDDDGVCDWQHCSLREAIALANVTPQLDQIEFDIPSSDSGFDGTSYVILLHAALPSITAPIIIDGTTQAGGQIVVDGGNGDFNGLVLTENAGGSTIRGLVLRGFGRDGIRIQGRLGDLVGSGSHTISGNTIVGNGGNGITVINSANNRFVGNDISDNGGLPIDLGGDGPTDNDPGDPDNGANFVQNYPDLIRAVGFAAAADPDTLQIVGTLNSRPGTYSVEFFISPTCNTGGQTLLNPEPLSVTIAADATETGFAANIGVVGDVAGLLDYGVRAIATDADGNSSEENNCIHVSYGNDNWVNSFEQTSQLSDQASVQNSSVDDTTSSFDISQYLDRFGQSRWYKLKVSANSKVKFELTDLTADYNLAVYKDVEEAYLELNGGVQDLNKLGAEVASDPLNPSASTADAFRTAQTAGSALNGSALNGSALNGSALNGSALNGSALNGSALNGSALNGSALNGSALNGSALNALAVNGSALNGSALNGSALNAEELARIQSSALARTLIAVSAAEGNSPESVEINTWNNAGYIYLRVWGTEGAFDTDSPFTLTTTLTRGLCEAVTADSLPATSLAAVAGGYETLIIADWERLYDTDLTGYAFDQGLADRLAALNAEVGGVVVDVGQDARVAAANALADAHADCSYGKNLVAEAIQTIVDDYRIQNPVKYIVIVGNDDIIPFYRYPDNALLGPEAQYFVPNRFGTSSYAALRQNYVLTQDQYGSDQCISLKENCFPIPQIPVGRLVESPDDMKAVLDAYLNGGEVLTPQAALVTGYDFLEDAALEIRDELAAGVPTVDGDLIDPQKPGPVALAEQGLAWTASELIDKLRYNPADPADVNFDLFFLAGHFTSASALAGDYKTTVLTTDLPSDMTNKLVYSAGCHVSHNSVDWHNIPGTTLEPDWAQALASRGATLIGGTGYQYGDTDILEFSERLYLYFTEELGKQLDSAGADVRDVAIGDALVAAKQRYLRETPLLRGIHEKTLLISTIYGLPMLKVNLPSRPIVAPGDAPLFQEGDLTPVAGNGLGLRVASYTHVPDLVFQPKELRSVEDPDTVIQSGYWVGDGVVANPGEPIVPVESLNVTPPNSSFALRGVGLTGACYTDEVLDERIPLTGAPATEASSAHIRFYSDRFIPEQIWSENHFGALFGPSSSSSTSVDVMPVQYRSDVNSLPAFVYTERIFTKLELRMFYDDALTTDPAQLAPAPAIVRVASTYDEAAGADFEVTVAGDTLSGVQDVWILWTDLLDRDNVAMGCAPGEMRWNDLPLVQNPANASLWSANLGLGLSRTEVADRIRFIVFAAGKAGATSWATNQGAFYPIGANAAREVTSLILDAPQDVSGPVGATISASAALLDDMGKPLANRSIVFGLAQQTRTGVTGADGRATVDLPIYGIPGTHDITASFPGSPVYAPSTAAPQSFVVSQQSSTLKLSAGASDPNEDAVFVATLVDGVSPDPNILAEQTVFFYFTDEKGATIIRTAITGLFGEARLGRDGYVDGIGEGTYRVFAEFKGSPSYSGSESNALEYQQGKTPASPSIQRLFLPSVSSIRIRAGEVSGARSEAGVVQLPFVTEK